MALKILATGDIHIGKKSSGVPENIEESATKFTWNRIVDWSIKNGANVVVLTGDIIDNDNRYFEAIGPLQSGFEKLKQADIAVFMVSGNHDYDVLSQMVVTENYDNVNLLGSNGQWEIKKISKNGEEIQFVGWSFPNAHFSEDPFSKFDVTEIDTNITTIGLLHGDVDIPESKYAPINSNNFLNKSVDTWILGHIHKPRIIRESDPHVCYPGSPHALSSKEQGIHGPLLLTIEKKDDIHIRQIPLSPVRYENIAIDITHTTDELSLRDTVTSGLINDANKKIEQLQGVSFLIYDLSLEGQHGNLRDIEKWILPIVDDYDHEIDTETRLAVRKAVVNARPKVENIKELASQSSPVGILAKTIIALQNDKRTNFLDEILEKWQLKHESINGAVTYQPLRTTDKFHGIPDAKVKQHVLRECNRLLGELIAQQIP